MSDMMSHKGYLGSVRYSDEDLVFHGKVEFIRDLVTYEGTSVKSLREAFREAVDDYLDLCRREGREPEKPFKGTFNVRTGPELHRKAAAFARSRGTNLNTVVADALRTYLGEGSKPSRKKKGRPRKKKEGSQSDAGWISRRMDGFRNEISEFR